MSFISDLPVELQNKIFFYAAEHPIAKIVRKHIEITEEKEMSGYFCYPSNVLDEISCRTAGVFVGSCDHCNKNGRILDGNWLICTGADVCIKCLNDDKIRKLYYNDFIPVYDDYDCVINNDNNDNNNDNNDDTEDEDEDEDEDSDDED